MVERMELDETGFPQPTGELEELEADSLVLALGQETDLSLLDGVPGVEVEDGVVKVGARHDDRPPRRSSPAATWCRPSAPSRSGSGTASRPRAQHRRVAARARVTRRRRSPSSATFDALNTWYYADAPHDRAARSSTRSRARSTFDEVVGGLDESNALFEARRCLSCGNCFACDNCYGVCPDNAVIKLEPGAAYGYAIDLDFCKGCGLCASECPCGAIEMEPETI